MTLEKILGKNYKWWFTLKYYFKIRTTYRVDNFFFALANTLTLLGTVLIWFFANNSSVDVAFKEKFSYFIFGTLFFCLVNIWPSFYGYQIKNGAIVIDLIRPGNLFVTIFFKFLGVALYQNITSTLIILITAPFWISLINYDITLINLIIVSLLAFFSLTIHFLIEIIIGLLAFFTTEINGIILNFDFLKSLFMGRLIPLNIIITGFSLNLLNPLSFLFYQPMQILFGNYTLFQSLVVLFVGVVWTLILIVLANRVLKFGLKKFEGVGL